MLHQSSKKWKYEFQIWDTVNRATHNDIRSVSSIRYHELSTPLSQAHFVAAHEGATYGLEMSRERMRTGSLRCTTPLPDLYLAGQDAAGPGVQGAFMGGFMAAATVEPRLFRLST